jgi:hypothetical protein
MGQGFFQVALLFVILAASFLLDDQSHPQPAILRPGFWKRGSYRCPHRQRNYHEESEDG